MISVYKLPDSVCVHGRAGVCRSEFRAFADLCCVCFLFTLCLLWPDSLHLSSLSCCLPSSKLTNVNARLPESIAEENVGVAGLEGVR